MYKRAYSIHKPPSQFCVWLFNPHVLSGSGSIQYDAGARFITNLSLKIQIPLKHIKIQPFPSTTRAPEPIQWDLLAIKK